MGSLWRLSDCEELVGVTYRRLYDLPCQGVSMFEESLRFSCGKSQGLKSMINYTQIILFTYLTKFPIGLSVME